MIETTLDGKTKDIVQDNIEQLKQLFPEIITEDKIDFDKLREILGEEIDDSNERYDFTWKGKHEATKIALNSSEGTLRPDENSSKNWKKTKNLYIEGDNLEVLKLLQKSYYGKIKMIYLDPPYNTGHDFVYEDNFTDNLKNYLEQDEKGFNVSSNPETSGRYHTNWLNMMYPRLKLSRNLLNEEGILFLSIDDNEIFNIKKMCDEIFGEQNCLCIFPRVTKKAGKSSDSIAKNNDYLLAYSKSNNCILYPFEHDDPGFKFSDEHESIRGKYKLNQTLDYDTLGYINSLDYPIEINGKVYYPGNVSKSEYESRKKENPKDGYRWRWSEDLFKFGLENDFVVVKEYEEYERIYTKTYQKAKIIKNNDGKYSIEHVARTKPLSSLEFIENKYSNDNSKKNLVKIFDSNIFEYSKPVELMKKIIAFSTKNNDLIMDFFSGSSTVAQAVLENNFENNNKCNFIMIQIPEKTDEKSLAYTNGYKNICEIGKERINRAGEKLIEEHPDANIDIGFKVFKLDTSNLNKWNPDIDDLENSLINVRDNIIEGRTELDLVYEIMLKYGLELTLPVKKIEKGNYTFYSVGVGSLVVCLNDHIKRDVSEYIIKIKEKLSPNIMRVVFKDNGFESDSDKTNVKEILRNNEIDEFVTI